jgi:hypothetical protein
MHLISTPTPNDVVVGLIMLCLFPCSTPTQEVAKKYKIHSIPTFYFIRHGETLESFATTNPDKLEDTIKKYYAVGTPASASASA